jgi:SAM-dependent methyltransferase
VNFNDLETLSGAFCESRILHTAVKLDLFAAVADAANGASATEAAQSRGLNPRATELLLNAMTGMELLTKQEGRFFLTELTRRHLLPSSPHYFGGMIALEGSDWAQWEKLDEAVRTGDPVYEPGSWAADEADTRRFILAMDSLVRARGDAEHVAQVIDFAGVTRLLDVGAGPGTYPMAACRAHPNLSATIFDLPATIKVTRELLAERDMAGRVSVVEGDFNVDPLPGGFGMVFMSNIIHGENESNCRALIKKCFEALEPGGRLVIKDHILSADGTLPADGSVFSLRMLLLTHGRDYSLDEISSWLAEAGFEAPTETVLTAPFSSSLVIAKKPV